MRHPRVGVFLSPEELSVALAARPDMKRIYHKMLKSCPLFIDRKTAAALVSEHLFPTYPRKFESYPLQWQHVAGHAMAPTAELLRIAFSYMLAGPTVPPPNMTLRRRSKPVIDSRDPEIVEAG
jgi:hypothetical protein